MNRYRKFGWVGGGYAVAFAVASAAERYRQVHTQGPDAQASAGMYAFGDAVLFCAVFALVGLVPTALALWFMRPVRKFWTVLGVGALAVAGAGVVLAIMMIVRSPSAASRPFHAVADALALLTMFASPVLAAAFALAALLSTARGPRNMLLGAAAAEAVLGGFWFLRIVGAMHRP